MNSLSVSLSSGYVTHDQPQKAIELYHQIRKPDDIVTTVLFTACAQLRGEEALKSVKTVLSTLSTSSLSDPILVTSLLDALMKCGDVPSAQLFFDRSTRKDLSMYGAMMKGKREVLRDEFTLCFSLLRLCDTQSAPEGDRSVPSNSNAEWHHHESVLQCLCSVENRRSIEVGEDGVVNIIQVIAVQSNSCHVSTGCLDEMRRCAKCSTILRSINEERFADVRSDDERYERDQWLFATMLSARLHFQWDGDESSENLRWNQRQNLWTTNSSEEKQRWCRISLDYLSVCRQCSLSDRRSFDVGSDCREDSPIFSAIYFSSKRPGRYVGKLKSLSFEYDYHRDRINSLRGKPDLSRGRRKSLAISPDQITSDTPPWVCSPTVSLINIVRWFVHTS